MTNRKLSKRSKTSNAAGALSEYAGNVKPGIPMREARTRAWEKSVREKTNIKKGTSHR